MAESTERAQADLLHELFDIPTDLQTSDAPRERLNAALERTQAALAGFRMITEATMAGLYLIQDGVFQYVNPAFVELFGYASRQEIEGRPPEALAQRGDIAKVREYTRRLIEGEDQAVHYRFRGARADGAEILCEVLGRAVEIRAQPAIVGTLFDITEREQTHANLIESEALFRGVSEKSPNMILIVKGESIVYCNRTCSQVTGHTIQQLTEAEFSFFDLIAPQSLDLVQARFSQHCQGDEGAPYSYRMHTREGREIEVSQSTRLIQHEGELAVLAVITDVTERNAVEREREQLLSEAQQRLEHETALKDATRVFASTLDLDEVHSHLAEKLCAAADATSAYIRSFDAKRGTSITLAHYHSPLATEHERALQLGAASDPEAWLPGTIERIERGKPMVAQIEDDELGNLERHHMQRYGATASLLIPLRVAGQIDSYAEIFESREQHQFSEQEIELCWAIAQQAAMAIKSGRLYQQANREIEERVRAQQALRQSEQRYRAVAESAFTGIAIVDRDSRLTYVNPAFAELLKSQVEDLEGLLLSELMDEDQWQIVQEQTRARMRGERSQYELRLNRRDGEKRQVLISASPILDAAGNFQAAIGVITDITELTAAQDALSVAIVRMEEALDRTRQMAETEEALRDTISSLSESLNLDEVLDRILENVGRVVPHDTADIMLLSGTGDDRELRVVRGRGYRERGNERWLMQVRLPWKEMQNFRRMERTGRPVAISDTQVYPGWVVLPETAWIHSYAGAPLRHKGRTIGFLNLCSEHLGTYRQVHAENLQVFADQAAVAIENARLFSQAQDEITERKRVEGALRNSENRYRNLFEGVRDAIIVESLQGEILEINSSALELFGWRRERVIGKGLHELLPEIESVLSLARRDPQALPAQPIEFDNLGGGDRTIPVELRFQLHHLDERQVLLVVGRDTTDRKVVEEAERELARMKVQFVLSASHSLKTPLHTLMGFLELLNSGKVRDAETQADFLKRASVDAEKINELIGDLLDTARIEIGDQGLSRRSVGVDELLAEVLRIQSPFAAERQITIEYRSPSPELKVHADPPRLVLAVGAILNNAVKYSEAGSTVKLAAEAENGQVSIRVADRGPGLPEVDPGSLFEPEVGRAGGRSGQPPGTGLGLYLAHNVVKAHGGRIDVESQPGKGSRFTIRIPRG